MVPGIRWLPLGLLAAGVFFTAGCSFDPSINVTFKWNLKPGEMKWYVEESDPGGQRKVNISLKPHPSDSNVAVALIFREDLEEAKKALKEGNEPPKYLRSHVGGGMIKFEPTIVAKGKAFAVVIRNGIDDSSEVELKITAK